MSKKKKTSDLIVRNNYRWDVISGQNNAASFDEQQEALAIQELQNNPVITPTVYEEIYTEIYNKCVPIPEVAKILQTKYVLSPLAANYLTAKLLSETALSTVDINQEFKKLVGSFDYGYSYLAGLCEKLKNDDPEFEDIDDHTKLAILAEQRKWLEARGKTFGQIVSAMKLAEAAEKERNRDTTPSPVSPSEQISEIRKTINELKALKEEL